ncbi:WUN-like protein [Mya arenaria]|uniref:WUN-like protein n=1 Tax=Mya arenaria TaxID=6604 RepID=A0ABY7FPV0_MYAAR|nr:WUN-like protein [Mya arenaria]
MIEPKETDRFIPQAAHRHRLLTINRYNMEPIRRRMILRVLFDVICIACVGLPVIILFFAAKPYQRGFYCDDQTLMHPYLSNTIPTWVAGFVGIVLPCVTLVIPFFFGAGLCQLTTDIAKYTVGRLRPHFLTVCQPDAAVCAINSGCHFPPAYIQFKFTWKRYWLVRPVFQAIAFFLAYYTALSRISDYMHHWSDVLSDILHVQSIAMAKEQMPGLQYIASPLQPTCSQGYAEYRSRHACMMPSARYSCLDTLHK